MKLSQFKQLVTDDEAVSPVIGVILMVAITVILAAVIGTFVLGLGDDLGQTAPSANYDVEDAGTNDAALVHSGGDPLNPDELQFAGEDVGENTLNVASGDVPDEITAGGTIAEVQDGSSDESSIDLSDFEEGQLVWEDPDSGETQVLFTV